MLAMIDNQLINQFIEKLDHPDWHTRQNAKSNLLGMGYVIVQPLIDTMLTEKGYKCWEAATLLAQIDDPRWIAPMQSVLRTKHPILGQVAVGALERCGSSTIDALLAALPDNRYMVQMQIVSVLERIGDSRATLPLLELLDETDSAELCRLTLRTLGAIGDKRARSAVQSYVDAVDHHIREAARTALLQMS